MIGHKHLPVLQSHYYGQKKLFGPCICQYNHHQNLFLKIYKQLFPSVIYDHFAKSSIHFHFAINFVSGIPSSLSLLSYWPCNFIFWDSVGFIIFNLSSIAVIPGTINSTYFPDVLTLRKDRQLESCLNESTMKSSYVVNSILKQNQESKWVVLQWCLGESRI